VEIVPESEWEGLFEEIVKHKGTAIIIGATDSGKSTLARYLIRKLISEKFKVSLVDSDVGQSSIGLPGTISMKVFCNKKELEDFRFERMFFVGTINPAKKIPLIIDSTKRMSDFCKEKSDITLIDTSGLISGEVGKALKIKKIRTIKPEHIIALQREEELEHILNLIENLNIHRIRTSTEAKIRSIAARISYRKKKLEDYFNEAEIAEFLLHLNEARFFHNGKPIGLKDREFTEGTIIGLNHDGDTLALGVVIEVTDNSLTFRSPIKSLKKINEVTFGNMTIY
jgi:polynucleotide 5'-hydroxyl-kinase GRC3/NOL9